jgi:signal transduction histidine kinase
MKFWSRYLRNSLTGKLVLLFLSMAVLFVVLVGGSMGKVFRDHFDNNIRSHLYQYLEYVQHDIGTPPNRQRAAELADKLHVDIYIVDADGVWASNNTPIDFQALEMGKRFQKNNVDYAMARIGNNEVFMIRLDDTSLYFAVPNLHPERNRGGFAPLVVLLLVLFLLYYFTQRMIRPVATLAAGVRQFGQGDLEYRVKLKRRDELGQLADNFNEMADDIQQMLDAKRQLLLAISHELRSPLTRAKVSLELIGDDVQRGGLDSDLLEMERLIEELLETERLSTSHRKLNMHACNLTALIETVLREHFADREIEQVLDSDSITMEVDPARLKLLLKNLLENALTHTPEGVASPKIFLHKQSETVSFTIQDFGVGIAAEQIPFLTEPFYRGDTSRRRETGGYGLGLYLCRHIAEADGGQLIIESEDGRGTSVLVKLPYVQ